MPTDETPAKWTERIWVRETDDALGHEVITQDDRPGLRWVEPGWVEYVRGDIQRSAAEDFKALRFALNELGLLVADALRRMGEEPDA